MILSPFLGGISLSVPVHALLLLNGSRFGISGFLHRSVRGELEDSLALAGLVFGGIIIGLLESTGPEVFTTGRLPLILSGLLVGAGSKMSNGCTSGHMLVGVSRFSSRSIAATAAFFFTGVITAQILHQNDITPAVTSNSSTSHNILFLIQTLPLLVYGSTTYFAPSDKSGSSIPTLRLLTNLVTAFNFAIGLHLSTLTESSKVLGFLLLPFRPAFDPSLAYLAAGALPGCIFLYRFCRGDEKPRLGGTCETSTDERIDARLLIGAALFGIGWGIAGICPGPGIVNFGRALSSGANVFETAVWIVSAVVGGLLPVT